MRPESIPALHSPPLDRPTVPGTMARSEAKAAPYWIPAVAGPVVSRETPEAAITPSSLPHKAHWHPSLPVRMGVRSRAWSNWQEERLFIGPPTISPRCRRGGGPRNLPVRPTPHPVLLLGDTSLNHGGDWTGKWPPSLVCPVDTLTKLRTRCLLLLTSTPELASLRILGITNRVRRTLRSNIPIPL